MYSNTFDVLYRSTAITKQTLEAKFPELFLLDSLDDSKTKTIEDFASSNPDEVANVQKSVDMTTEYMAQFRADNIVLDAEEIKDALMEPTEEPVAVRFTVSLPLSWCFIYFRDLESLV